MRKAAVTSLLLLAGCWGGDGPREDDPYEVYMDILDDAGPGADPETVERVVTLLRDGSSYFLREAGLRALIKLERPGLAGRAVPLLKDPHPLVRESACRVVGHYRHAAAASKLVTRVQEDPQPEVRRAAIAALGRMPPSRKTLGPVQRALTVEDPSVRRAAFMTLRKVSGEPFPAEDVVSWEAWIGGLK